MTEDDVWFLDVATRLKELLHTDDNKRYARNLDEYKLGARAKFNYNNFTLVRDEEMGKIDAEGDNRHEDAKVGFWILKKCKSQDWAEEQTIYEGAKAIMYKILSRCEKERLEKGEGVETVMEDYVPESVSFKKVGPDIDNCFGVYCSFSRLESVNGRMVYDAGDWE